MSQRFFRRDKGISVLIVLVLAVGIGGNAALFTLLKAAFLDPLPFANADRIVTILGVVPDKRINGGVNRGFPNISEFAEIRRHSRTLNQLTFLDHRDFQLSGIDEPARVFGARVTASFFPLLDVRPAMGRTFADEENQPGLDHVVVLTNHFWRTRMGSAPGALGQKLRLNGEPYSIVGVLPSSFSFDYPSLGIAETVDIYVPYPIDMPKLAQAGVERGQSAIAESVRVLARLGAGASQTEAGAELRTIASTVYTPEYRIPGVSGDKTFEVQLLQEAIVGNQSSLLWLLTVGNGVFLLIACANTAQLLLAQSIRRGREVAIRAALGASRGRLIRQFMAEGAILAGCGGGLGLLLSSWLARMLVRFLPVRSPLLEAAHLDFRVLGFTLALSALSAIVFATVPAIKGSMWTLGPALTMRTTIGDGNRWRHIMIAVEAALSVFLLCGAGLIAQNLRALLHTPTGFDPKQVLVMQLRLPPQRDQAYQRSQEYLQRITAIPGVDVAAIAHAIPLRPRNGGFITLVGEGPETFNHLRPTWGYFVSPDYFRALGIPLIAGRAFRSDDTLGKMQVAVVNQEFVRSHGIEANPLGRQIDDGPSGRITIVGVVGNVRIRGAEIAPEPQLYTPYLQYFQPLVNVVVRSSLAREQLISRVKTAIRSSYSEQAVFNISTMEDLFFNSIATPRFNASLAGAFSLLALVLAVSGMYSVVSFIVSQRTNEIAIRIALGARRPAIIRIVLMYTMLWVVAGLAGGIVLGVAASRTIQSLSSSVIPASHAMYAAVTLFFLGVALLAAWSPVRRATRVDPATALREE